MVTNDNLGAAFAGESRANRRYLAFAKKAEEDGKPNVARLFRAAAAAETVHAHNHLRVMGGIGTTQENLKAAISGENYEHTKMYPMFIEEARGERIAEAERTFSHANEVEKVHEMLYSHAAERVAEGKDIDATDYWVCQTC